MNIVAVTTVSPFSQHKTEETSRHLVRALVRAGHAAELMRIPFSWNPAERIIEQMALSRSLRVINTDRLIALAFPAYLIPHRSKVIWLLDSTYEERSDGRLSSAPGDGRGDEIRRLVRESGRRAMREAAQVYATSAYGAGPLLQDVGISAKSLPPPLNDAELFRGGDDDGYIIAPGTVCATGRQWLVVEALRHAPPAVRLIIAGPAGTSADGDDLRRRVAEGSLEDRVTLDLRSLDREEMANLVNRARAVAYVPAAARALGDVLMQACEAAKPVLTCMDAGSDTLRLLHDGETGYITLPRPDALGEAMTELWSDPMKAKQFGARARERWRDMGVDWTSTVAKLTG